MLDNINEEVVKLGYCRNVIKENNKVLLIINYFDIIIIIKINQGHA